MDPKTRVPHAVLPHYQQQQEDGLNFTLKVNIEDKTAHISEGVAVGLREERERTSTALGRTVVFKGATVLTALPPYLTLQMMRFFFRLVRHAWG
jgi:ubiquitin carboxyl-terminal hydrolase 14